MAFEIAIKFHHDCKLIEVRQQLEHDFEVFCTRYYDFYIFKGKLSEPQIEQFCELLDFSNEITKTFSQNSNGCIITTPCISGNIDHLMHFYRKIYDKFGIVFSYPLITQTGEQYTYHCLDATSHAKVLHAIQTDNFELISIREYETEEYSRNYEFSILDLYQQLTNHQMIVLVKAYQRGYYRIPREVRTLDLSQETNRSRYSVDKTLRTAEGKIMKYIYTFLL